METDGFRCEGVAELRLDHELDGISSSCSAVFGFGLDESLAHANVGFLSYYTHAVAQLHFAVQEISGIVAEISGLSCLTGVEWEGGCRRFVCQHFGFLSRLLNHGDAVEIGCGGGNHLHITFPRISRTGAVHRGIVRGCCSAYGEFKLTRIAHDGDFIAGILHRHLQHCPCVELSISAAVVLQFDSCGLAFCENRHHDAFNIALHRA